VSRRVPLRHSLVTRLLLTVTGVLIVAVGATAWLATQTATRAIRQEQGRSLADDKGLYEALVGYAATHPDWSAVGPLLHDQARELGRRITLTTAQRQVIADSATGPPPAMTRPSATVDPLRLDLGVTGGTETIDGRVVGPYRLTEAETRAVRKGAQDVLTCLGYAGAEGRIVASASGRPTPVVVRGGDPKDAMSRCGARFAGSSTPSEEKALRGLSKLMAACLGQPDPYFISVQVNWAATPPSFAAIDGSRHPRGGAQVRSCLEKSRRAQLEPYTAPPTLLFVTDPDTGLAGTTFNLSRGNVIRIAAVAGGILLVTILATVLLGRRLVGPLRALTESAALQTPAPVTTRDEIGYLATALNEAMRRRGEAESQRRAMVGDIAHELRNPLTNVRSWLEAAQDGLAQPDAQLLALLHDETVVLQHVVDDLTDLAAADAGTLRLHLAPVELRSALSQVVAAHAGAPLALSVSAPGSKIKADPVRLRQLVGNLVANAVRHTPPGGSVVTTGALDGGEAVITVRDTGIGIAPGDLPKVFDRFWRADPSRSRATGGSGLGLAIARQLARAHGGDITVTSDLGVGTTFTVRLPASPELES
jgi:two-component system sensor histidine kinase BaeS